MVFEFGVLILEVGLGRELHLLVFFFRDGIKWRAVNVGFTIFYFGEINTVFFGGDNIDFVKMSFVVSSDNSVAVINQVIRDGGLGFFTDISGVFL